MNDVSLSLHDLRVAEAMTTDVITLSACATMEEAAKLFIAEEIDGAPVVDEAGHVVGVLTTADFAKRDQSENQGYGLAFHAKEFELRRGTEDQAFRIVHEAEDLVHQHMTTALQTISAHQSLHDAACYLIGQKVHHLIVINELNRAIGLLTPLDILRVLIESETPSRASHFNDVRREVHHE